MKINLTKILPPFLLTFFVAIAVVSLVGYIGFGKTNANFYDLETKNVYAVLLKDAQIKQQRVENNAEYAKGKSISSLDSSVFKKRWLDAAKATNEIDTRQLPDDFQLAWKKYTNALNKTAEAFSNLPQPLNFNVNSVENKNWYNAVSEQNQTWSEVVSIAKKYGLKFDQYKNLIIENHSGN